MLWILALGNMYACMWCKKSIPIEISDYSFVWKKNLTVYLNVIGLVFQFFEHFPTPVCPLSMSLFLFLSLFIHILGNNSRSNTMFEHIGFAFINYPFRIQFYDIHIHIVTSSSVIFLGGNTFVCLFVSHVMTKKPNLIKKNRNTRAFSETIQPIFWISSNFPFKSIQHNFIHDYIPVANNGSNIIYE